MEEYLLYELVKISTPNKRLESPFRARTSNRADARFSAAHPGRYRSSWSGELL